MANELTELVHKDLKGLATENELEVLKLDPESWRAELIKIKLSCQSQLSASKARRFQRYNQLHSGEIEVQEYLDWYGEELVWRVNATRALQQVEVKLQDIKILA